MRAGRRKENDPESGRGEWLAGGGGHALSAEASRIGAQIDGHKCWHEHKQDPNLFPPILHNRNSGQVPMLCTEELEFDRGDVRLRIQCGCRVKPAPLHPGSLANGYAHSRQQRGRSARPVPVQALDDSPPRALQLHCDLVGPLGRRPVRHFEIGGNEVTLHDRGESSRDDARWYPEREQ